jgi:CNT family concentrative nucleoside transporter
MTVGMAGVAGTILAAYASMGIRIDYLIAAAFMSAPGGILMAKLIMPDDPNEPAVDDPDIALEMHEDEKPANLIMAASQGAQTGVRLAVAVGAMVLAFVALVALANGVLGGLGNLVGLKGLSFPGPAGLGLRAGDVWLLGALGRGERRWRAVRHQNRPQRIRRLHRSGRTEDTFGTLPSLS